MTEKSSLTTTRRSFVVTSAAALVASDVRTKSFFRHDNDLVIRNGTVFDGTGAEGREMDVAIAGDRIVEVGAKIRSRGREEIDAKGMAVSPGFLDIHSHGDGNMESDPRVESVIRQGVTTMVVGADGSSRANGSPEKSFASYFASVDQLKPGGRIVMPIGDPHGIQSLVKLTKRDDGTLEREDLGAVRFVPLIGEHGFGDR